MPQPRSRRLGVTALVVTLLAGLYLARPSSPEPPAPPGATPAAEPAAALPSPRPAPWRRGLDEPGVRCILPGIVTDGAEGEEVLVMALHHPEATQTALVDDGTVELILPPMPLKLVLDVPGHPALEAEYDGVRGCTVEPPPPAPARVRLQVRTASGRVPDWVHVHGCGLNPPDENGVVSRTRMWIPSDPSTRLEPGEPCELYVTLLDGYAFRRSEPARLHPTPGSEHEVTLILPEPPYAGLGLYVFAGRVPGEPPDAAPTVLLFPFAGGPADRAGIPERARLLAVDGQPADELHRDVLGGLNAGEEGTGVLLTIDGPEGPYDVYVTRALPDA